MIDVHSMMKLIQEKEGGNILLTNKEDVLDMLYIEYSNKNITGWSLKVFEKIFEESPVCFVPGNDPGSVSIQDTISLIDAISTTALQFSENVLNNQAETLDDLVMERDALITGGAKDYQLISLSKEIESLQNIVDRSIELLTIAETELKKEGLIK